MVKITVVTLDDDMAGLRKEQSKLRWDMTSESQLKYADKGVALGHCFLQKADEERAKGYEKRAKDYEELAEHEFQVATQVRRNVALNCHNVR